MFCCFALNSGQARQFFLYRLTDEVGSAHVELREDFLLLHERGETKACDALYQQLIEQLAGLDEKSLADDFQRTRLVVDPKTPDVSNPVWKYCVSVKKELQRRSEQRLARVLAHSEER